MGKAQAFPIPKENTMEWKDFTLFEKCLAVLFMAGAGAIGAGVLWVGAVIAACM